MIVPAILMAAAAACTTVRGDRITAADMAKADTAFSSVAPDTIVGYAPAPGTVRVLHTAEVARLAARFGLERQGGAEMCFERALRTLAPEDVLPAIRESLGQSGFEIEVLELFKGPVPWGRIVFRRPVAGLQSGSADGSLWRGYIEYGEAAKQRFPVWAKVRIHGAVMQIVAASNLSPGVPITEGSVSVVTRDSAPLPARAARSVSEVLGFVPRRRIAAGSAISLDVLDAPLDVHRGENVAVEARCGAARLMLDGLAQSDGRVGQVVTVRNPGSGKNFQAHIEGKGKVAVNGGGCK